MPQVTVVYRNTYPTLIFWLVVLSFEQAKTLEGSQRGQVKCPMSTKKVDDFEKVSCNR